MGRKIYTITIECDKLTEQLSNLKAERRHLQREITALRKKQKKADWYLARKNNPQKSLVQSPQPSLQSSSPEPKSLSSNLSAPQTPSSQSSPSPLFPTADSSPLPQSYSDAADATAPSPCPSVATVMVSSSDEAEPDRPSSLPPLEREMAILPQGPIQSCGSSNTPGQHFQ